MKFSPRYRRLTAWVGAALVVSTVALAAGHAFFAQAGGGGSAVVPHSISPSLSGAKQTGRVPSGQKMSVTLTLRPRNQAALETFVKNVSTPNSPQYHQFITPAAFGQTFGPDPAMVKQVQSFAQQAGLKVTNVQSGGMFITVSGTASQVESAFQTQLGQYRGNDGQSFFANTGELRVPNAIAPAILSISGVENATRRNNHATAPRALTPQDDNGQGAQASNTCPSQVGTFGLTPSQLQKAYNFPTGTGKNGAGQSVALVEFDGYDMGDINAFAQCFVPGVNVNNVVKTKLVDISSPLSPGAAAVEAELDIEVVLGMAPGISGINVYEAPNSNQGLIDMLAAIANANVDGTISDSWGACESDTGFSVALAEEMLFLQMAAQGQGFYAASGDSGAYSCLPSLQSSPYYHGRLVNADDPSSNPYVVGVGGTTLAQNASTSAYMGETVWNNINLSPTNYGATGGGYSQFWATPSWQLSSKASTTPGGLSNPTGARISPDVAADADPQTGYAMYCTVGDTCAPVSGWFDIGGTSAAAPLWAALAAITNQMASTRIGLITPALYALYGADTAATSTAAGIALGSTTYYDYQTQKNGATTSGGSVIFNDITSGNNSFPANQGFPTGYSAQTGYDATVGLGSMQGVQIASYLANNIRFTAPRLYMAAKGNDNTFWLSGYFLNNGNNNPTPNVPVVTGWTQLGGQQFQGAPAVANNGVSTVSVSGTTALVWISGVGTDGTVRFGSWNPGKMSFSGWTSVPGTTCKGNTAAAYAQGTYFVTCMTASGGIVLNAYNTVNGTWGGWAMIGGGLTIPPTMSTDGSKLLIFAQAPLGANDKSSWYTLYTVGTGAQTVWRRFLTTCLASPALAFTGPPANTYLLSCIAGDTSTMWTNTFDTNAGTLSGWVNLGAPAGIGFTNATAVSVDQIDNPLVLLYTGQGKDNAAYVMVLTDNPMYSLLGGWQMASLPGIFSSNMSTDYAGQ